MRWDREFERESRPGESPLSPDDLGDPRHPDRQSPFLQHRVIHESFLTFARRSFLASQRLITSQQQMGYEDHACFAFAEYRLNQSMRETLRQSMGESEASRAIIRPLHHVVAVPPSGERERHLILEVMDRFLAPLVVHDGCVERFSRGPVIHHVFMPSGGGSHLEVVPRMSPGAFKESLAALASSFAAGSPVSADSNWLLRASVSTICQQHECSEGYVQEGGRSGIEAWVTDRLRLGGLAEGSARLVADLGPSECSVLIRLNHALSEPVFEVGVRDRRSAPPS